MRKVVSLIIAIVLLIGMALPAFAQYDREAATSAGYVLSASTEHDRALVSQPAYIYAVTVWADAANSYVFLYDTTSAPVSTDQPKLEVGEATQYRSTRIVLDKPLLMSSGVYADVTAGSVVVEYR